MNLSQKDARFRSLWRREVSRCGARKRAIRSGRRLTFRRHKDRNRASFWLRFIPFVGTNAWSLGSPDRVRKYRRGGSCKHGSFYRSPCEKNSRSPIPPGVGSHAKRVLGKQQERRPAISDARHYPASHPKDRQGGRNPRTCKIGFLYRPNQGNTENAIVQVLSNLDSQNGSRTWGGVWRTTASRFSI